MEWVEDDLLGLFDIGDEHLGEAFIMDENTDLDAIYAQKLMEEDEKIFEMEEADELLAKKLQDEEMARQLQEEEERANKKKNTATMDEDAELARLLQIEEESKSKPPPVSLQDQRLAQQLLDEELARNLQRQLEQTQTSDADFLLAKKLAEDRDAELARMFSSENETFNSDAAIARQLAKDEEDEVKRREEEKQRRLLQQQRHREQEEARRIAMEEERRLAAERAARETEKALQIETMDPECVALIPETSALKTVLTRYHGCEIRRIIKPELRVRFQEYLASLKKKYGAHSPHCKPVWAFHGTKSNRMSSIEQKGLLVPGSSGVTHATDSGWYGRGIYLSPNCDVSLGYSDDGRLLICAVLMGKIFVCKGRLDGAGIQPNCDSHQSPGGDEYILFNPGQVLPIFVLNTRKNY